MIGRLTITTPVGTFHETYQLDTNHISLAPADEFWEIVLRRIDLLPNVRQLTRHGWLSATVECFDETLIDWVDPDDIEDDLLMDN